MNIVLITIDCLRADRFEASSANPDMAPFLHRLADRGTYCQHAYSNGPYTYASFPSLLTGTYALIHGGGESLRPDITTLAGFLASHGYRTVGVNSNPYLSKTRNYHLGFDLFIEFGESGVTGDYAKGIKLPYAQAGEVNRAVAKAISNHDAGKPLFLWIHYMDMHAPFSPPETFLQRFVSLDVAEQNKHLYGPSSLVKNFAPEDCDLLMSIYNACFSYCDHRIKELFEHVLGKDFVDQSLVFITADHGEEFFEYGRFGHYQALHEELIHIPMWVLGPGEVSPLSSQQLVSLIDIPVTIADVLGRDKPKEWIGDSLWQDQSLEEKMGEKIVFSSCKLSEEDVLLSARDRRWKLVTNEKLHSFALYDLDSENSEKYDVKDKHPVVTERMRTCSENFLKLVREYKTKTPEILESEVVRARLRALGYIE